MKMEKIRLICPDCGSNNIRVTRNSKMEDTTSIKCIDCWKIGKLWQFKKREPVTYNGR